MMQPSQVAAHISDVDTWNPGASAPKLEFQYIDLSAVDQDEKRISASRELLGADAPSRARQLVRAGDVLVSTVRPNLNGVARVPHELDGATASTGFCVLRADELTLAGEYLFHWVKSQSFVDDMVRKATGATYPAVSDRIVHDSMLPLPCIEEQRRIAAILDQAEALRAKRRQTLAKLDTLTQSLFLEMFGDPNLNPKQWPGATLSDVIHSASDGPHVSPTYAESGIPFLSTRHVRAGEISREDMKFLSLADAEVQWKKCRPQKGDILYTKGGTTGLAAVIDFDDLIAVWVHVAVLKPRLEIVDPFWLACMLNSSFCYTQSQRFTHGIANRDLGLKRMTRIKLYLPPKEKQMTFVHAARRALSLRIKASRQSIEIENLAKALQDRAFRGKL